MSTVSLPAAPSLEHLKSQAKDLLAAVRAADPDAAARVLPYFPASSEIGLNDTQLVIAREYGFASWARLKDEVALRAIAGADLRAKADLFAETAMRRDGLETARALLAGDPSLSTLTLAAAAASGDVAAVRGFLDTDPALTNAKAAPLGWEPLLYVCYSSLLKDVDLRPRLLDTARLLIDRGANVNASWYEARWTSDEACLYGATGVNDCPELARMLLDAGASPDDGESFYHATELPTIDCLKLLLDHGCTLAKNNGVAHLLDRELPDWLRVVVSYATPENPLPPVIPFAMRRGRGTECLRILIESGMDLNAPDPGQGDRTPYQVATRLGRTDVMALLEAAGADTTLSPIDAAIGALTRGEVLESDAITAEMIALLDAETPTPTMVVLGERANTPALAALLAAGANPDVADANGWTALHIAAMHGSLDSVRILLNANADPTLRDKHYSAQPIGFACHGSENDRSAPPEDYVQIVEALLDAGAELPETAWGSPEVREALVKRGAKAG